MSDPVDQEPADNGQAHQLDKEVVGAVDFVPEQPWRAAPSGRKNGGDAKQAPKPTPGGIAVRGRFGAERQNPQHQCRKSRGQRNDKHERQRVEHRNFAEDGIGSLHMSAKKQTHRGEPTMVP